MNIFTTKTNYTKTAFAFLAVLFCLMMKSEVTWGQVVMSYTTPGTYTFTVPAGVTTIKVEAWGGGSGGSTGYGGGGGGAYAGNLSLNVSPGNYTITVGAGGTATNNGNNSSFGNLIIAAGGNGRLGGTVANSTGAIRNAGGNGGTSSGNGGAGGGGSAGYGGLGGAGNNSSTNTGGAGGVAGIAGAGTAGATGGAGGNNGNGGSPGNAPGAGGGENGNGGSGSGAGGDGQVIITYNGSGYCGDFAQSVTSQTGVTNPNNSLGAPDGSFTVFNSNGDQLVLDLTGGNLLTSGGSVNVTWDKSSSSGTSPSVTVEASANGTTWTAVTGSPFSVTSTTFTTLGIPLGTATRYLRFTIANSLTRNLQLDAASYFTPCTPPASITTNTISPLIYCGGNTGITGTAISVPFTSSGTYTAGNIYTAQLSNNGFTSFISIGTLSSTASGSLSISGTIPAGTAAGANYRIRVVSSSPSVTGSDNGSNITINNPSAPTGTSPQTFCASANATVANLTTTTGSGIQWYAAASGGSPLATTTPLVNGTHYYASQTISGCEGSARLDVTVVITPTPNTTFTYTTYTYCKTGTSGLAALSGSPQTGTFSASPAGLNFVSTSNGQINLATSAAGTYSITYTVAASGGCGIYTYTQPTSVVIQPIPALFTVTGGGAYCSTGIGSPVGLSGSEAGVNYQLVRGGVTNVGAPLAGTGAALDFGQQSTAGTYTVVATNATTNCSNNMTGNAVISITTAPNTTFTYTTYTYCKTGTSGLAALSGSPQTGTFSASPAGLNFVSTSNGQINLATSTAGTYSITYTVAASGGCGIYTYTQPTSVVINAVPTAFNVTGSGTYCSNALGSVGLSGSEAGVNYQLVRGGVTNVGAPLAGTGAALDFGQQSTAGTYTVVATNATTNCSNNMTGNAVISITTAPNTTFTYTTYTYCKTGTSGLAALSGSPQTGTFSASPAGLNFVSTSNGQINLATSTAGTYSITYTVAASGGCGIYTYTQPTSVVINAVPTAFNVTGSGTYCSNALGSVGLSGSEAGVNYQLVRGGVTNVGTPLAGTGAALDFGQQSTAGTYTVVATNATTNCSNNMTGNAVISITTAPNTTFTYTTYTYCKTGTSGLAALSGSPQTGTFSASPAGLNFVSTSNGQINLATSTAGTYSITYTVAASGGCGIYTYTQPTSVVINAVPTASAGSDIVSCSVPIPMTGATAGGTYSSIAWSGGAGLGTFSGSGTDPSTYIFTPSVSQGSFTATLTVNGAAPCTANNPTSTRKITWGFTGAWLGVTSTDWFTASNWCGGVPTAISDVTIPAVGSVPNQPTIGGAGAVCRNITNNGTLTITGANNLDVYGDWTNNGTYTFNTSSITFRGSSNNILAGSNATTFYNLIVNKGATANTLTSTTKAFAVNNNLTITQGDLILTAIDVSYNAVNITVPAAGILTDNVNWDGTHLLSVTGNIAIDGIFNYTSPNVPHVNMNGAGSKTVRSGTNAASGFGYLTLSTGTYSASGQLVINSNFWSMFGTPGSFSTNGQTVIAKAGVFVHGGTLNINGGSLTVTGGLTDGYPGGLSGIVNFSSGTLNADAVTVGPNTPAVNGVFNQSGGVANIGDLLINNTTTASAYTCSNSPTINITGNWTNNETAAGSFAAATSQVNFNGTSASTIGGTSPTTFYNLSIANVAGVSLSTSTNVSNTLNLSSGLVTTGANVLTITAAGTAITGGSASSYVNGKLAKIVGTNGASSYIFKIGKGGNYRPLTFAYTTLSSQPSTVTVEQFESALTGTLPTNITLYPARYWDVAQSGGTAMNYTVTLDPTGYTPVGPYVKILKKEGGTITATDATTPNYTNATTFTTFNNTNDGTNSFALAHDCSSTAAAGAVLDDICQGGTSAPLGGSISGTATGGLWTDGGVGGTFTPSATNLNATWTPPAAYFGTATLTLTPTGGLCAPNTANSKTQKVIQAPTGTLTASATTICAGSSVTFTFLPVGVGSYIFKVNGVQKQSGTANVFSSSTLTNGQSVTVDVANGNNCGATFGPIIINVNPLPTVTLNADKTIICAGDNVTFTATGGTSYNFKINGSSVITNTTGTFSSTTLNNNDAVTVDVTDGNSCTATSAPVNITVNSAPNGTLTATTPTSVCPGTTVSFKATGGTQYQFKVNGAIVQPFSVIDTYGSNSFSNGDVVTVDVKNASGCMATYSPGISVTIRPIPTGTITTTENSGTSNDNNICAGANVKFTATAGFTHYTFYLQNTTTILLDGASNVLNTTSMTDGDYVTVVVTNGSTCTNIFPASATIHVVPSPAGTLSVSPSNTICAGDNVIFTADPGFDNYKFEVNGSTVQNGNGNTFSTTTLADNDIVSVDVTNSNDCISTFTSITMHVNALPTGTLQISENSGTAPDDGIICTGASVIFTAPAGFTNYNFLLNGASVQNSLTQRTYTTTSLADNNKVTIAVTGTGGCIALLNEYTITVNPLPTVAAITGPDEVCLNGMITLSDATSSGGTFAWTSETPGIATIDAVTGVVTGVAPGMATIDYTYTSNTTGCGTTVHKTITVNAPPDVEPIIGNFNICTGYTSQLSDATNTGGTWVWSSDNTGAATVDPSTGLVTGVAPGNANISYAFTDGNGCTTVVTAGVVVTSTPSIAAITTTAPAGFNVCIGGTLKLKDATPSGIWSSNDPSKATVDGTGLVTGISAVLPSPIISYTITTSCGGMISATQEVIVHAPPTATISYAGTPFCTTAPVVSVTKNGSDGDGSAGTYSALPTGLSIDPSTGDITPSASTPGTYTITYKILASGGCGVYTTTASVTITQAPSATISYNGSPYCSTGGTASVTRTGAPGGTYTKTAGAGTLSLNSSTGDITLGTSTPGTYTVTYTIAASGGCAQFTTGATIVITQAPSATITYSGSPYCVNAGTSAVTITGTTGGTYTKTAGAGTLFLNSSTGDITLGTSTPGTYTVTYTVAALGGCSIYTTTTSVTITAAPIAVAGNPVVVCSNASNVSITSGASASNNSSVLWTSSGSAGTITNPTSLNGATYTPSVADIVAGSITLTLKANGNGNCAAATSTKTLTISALPAAPTITPTPVPAICLGNIQPLSAGTAPTTGSATNSFSGSVTIGDNQASGAVSTLSIAGVPAGAVINSVSVNFNISHNNVGDLRINLKAPNGNVLNLVNREGGSGNNFTNTTINSTSGTPLTTAPFTGTFAPDAVNGVTGATSGGGNTSNVTSFAGLYSTPNGTWQFSARDVNTGTSGTITSWSITINYTITSVPTPVVWSPNTDLYTDAGATIAYTGTSVSTVYLNPSTSGAKTYLATATNANNCSSSTSISVPVNPLPTVSIAADYCSISGKVLLTATHSAGTTVLWSTGKTTDTIQVDEAGDYSVTATNTTTGCTAKATRSVANELVTNGDFTSGNTAFTSDYTYHADVPGLVPAGQGELYDDSGTNGYSITTDGQNVHINFWGQDHTVNTTGTRNFMAINGHGNTLVIWKQTVNVLPNTDYYFSAWGMSLNNVPVSGQPNNGFAILQFNVNGSQVGSIDNLAPGVSNNSNNGWSRFYGTLHTGPTTTTAVISITNLQTSLNGNDFGLDDISFSTLSTFLTLESGPGTDAQTVCVNTPITNIVYSYGNGNSSPIITGLPLGVTAVPNGEDITISGTPTVAGNYTYTITTTGCSPYSVTGTINVQAQKIALSSGSSSPSVCVNSPMPGIVFTLSGTATGATITTGPAFLTGSVSGSGPTYTYTLTGTPTAAGSYPYTITTSGTCDPVTFSGTITVTAQTIALNAGDNDNQTVCINKPIDNIRYTIGGTATGAGITGLPPGVTGSYSGGIFTIKGSPTDASGSPYTYTLTTTGTCAAVTATGTITVTPGATLTLTSGATTDAQTVCKGTPINDITYALNNATDAIVTGLPPGVTGSASGGIFTISGAPTAASVVKTYNYTITTTDGCTQGSATGSITIQAQTISLSSGAVSPSVCPNLPMADIVYKIGGTATGAMVTGLPTGVTGTLSGNLFTIGGIPTDPAGSYTYTITTSGSCDPVMATGTITISDAAVGGTLTSSATCSGTNGTLTLSGKSGNVIGWEYSTNNGATWTTVTPNNTQITLTFNVTVPTQYRVIVGNTCGNVYSTVATAGVFNYWTGITSDDWSDPSNWSGNQVATLSCPMVVIPAGTPHDPVIHPGTNAVANSLTINSGASLTMNGTGNLTLSSGATFTNNGTFTANAGTGIVKFNGAGTINGSTVGTFNNLTMNGALTLTKAPAINGNFTINSGNVLTNSPTYTNTSTLVYNLSGAYTTGLEWNAGGPGTITPGVSVPQNVSIQSGVITIPNSPGANRALAGNMNISTSATLQMTAGSRDLYIAGNWTNTGTFIANGRRVTFDATSGTQSVSGNTTFFDLTLNNSGATTDFTNSNITVSDEFRITAGTMNGNISTFIFTGAGSTLEGTGSKNFYNLQINTGANVSDLTASAGNTHIAHSFTSNGSFTQTALHITYFDKSNATETFTGTGSATFGNLTIGDGSGASLATTLNASADFTITGGSLMFFHTSVYNGNNNTAIFSNAAAAVTGSGIASFNNATANVAVNFGSGISTINGNLLLNNDGFVVTNVPNYGSASTLTYNKTTPVSFNPDKEWNNNSATAGLGIPENVSITNTNSIVLLADRTVPGMLNLSLGSLDINGNTLAVNSGFTGTGGNLKGGVTSNLIVGGTGTINFDPSANSLKNFTINNTANLNLGNALIITPGDFAINNFGTVTANGTLNTNANLTLRSGRYGDAIIGNSSGKITGNVTVERFIPEGRAWRFLTAPVTSTQSINQAWQDSVANPDVNTQLNPYPGSGTDITYDNNPANGYDVNTTTNPSIKYWNPVANNFLALPGGTISTKLNDYQGYYLFVRGSRAVNLAQGIYAIQDATVLRSKGTLAETGVNSNTITVPSTGTTGPNQYFFVGNPYASPIDLSGIINGRTSGYKKDQFWVWDPKLTGTFGVGAYVVYSNGIGWVPAGGSYATGDAPVIQSGQAFMVQLNAASTSVEFRQADKDGASEGNVFGKQHPGTQSVFYTNLLTPSANGLILMDGVAAGFSKDNSLNDEKDVSKKWNALESIGLFRDNAWQAIEFRPIPVVTDTLFYSLYYMQQRNYVLQITTQNVPAGFPQAWLVDKYLNTKTAVIPGTPLLYNFTATSDINTYRSRFMLVFKRTLVVTPIPVTKVINQANPGTTGNANSIAGTAGGVSVHPNPVTIGEKVILQFSNMNKGKYEVTVTNIIGKALTVKTIIHDGGSNTYSLQTDTRWAAGSYFVKIIGDDYNLITKLVITK